MDVMKARKVMEVNATKGGVGQPATSKVGDGGLKGLSLDAL